MTKQLTNLKIVSLTSENVKRLVAVHIEPNGNVVEIAGRNGQGKTSVLDSIWWALAGTKNIQSQPIRKGETKARIRLDMGEIVVERRFTPGGSTLAVTTADGAKYPNPQAMLDALIGAITFDPLAFSRMKPEVQYALLTRMVPLSVDVPALNKANADDYAARTEVNRTIKSLTAQADGIFLPDVIPEPVDVDALVTQIEQVGEHNADIERRRERRAKVADDIATFRATNKGLTSQAADLRARADALDVQAAQAHADADALQARLDEAPPLPEPLDAAALRAEYATAREGNAVAERSKVRAGLIAEAARERAKSEALTVAMEAREKAKADALAAADMPVKGLGLGDGIVLFDGTPFDQASKAAQIRVGMAIAMAGNPALRVIRIEDGSLLDPEGMAAIREIATGADWQVWVERVATDSTMGFVIEDGHVAPRFDDVAVDADPADEPGLPLLVAAE